MVTNETLSLAPHHLKDLRNSGLSDITIIEASIKSVLPNEIRKKLGFDVLGLQSMYEIPYNDEYSRFRVFYDENIKHLKDYQKRPKYLTGKNSGNHLYIPHKVKPILTDISIPLYITEGEKKALKAVQEGLYCIAISGLWNWKVKDKDDLIPDFDLLALDGRIIYLVPDNDWLEPDGNGDRKNLSQAVDRLACKLIERGAKVSWIELPR